MNCGLVEPSDLDKAQPLPPSSPLLRPPSHNEKLILHVFASIVMFRKEQAVNASVSFLKDDISWLVLLIEDSLEGVASLKGVPLYSII